MDYLNWAERRFWRHCLDIIKSLCLNPFPTHKRKTTLSSEAQQSVINQIVITEFVFGDSCANKRRTKSDTSCIVQLSRFFGPAIIWFIDFFIFWHWSTLRESTIFTITNFPFAQHWHAFESWNFYWMKVIRAQVNNKSLCNFLLNMVII